MRKKQHDELVSAKVSVDTSSNKTKKPLAKEVVKKQTVKAQLKSQKSESTAKKTTTKIKSLKTTFIRIDKYDVIDAIEFI